MSMDKMSELFEKETGEKAVYRKGSSDYHTLKYVQWLEKRGREAEELVEKWKSMYAGLMADKHLLIVENENLQCCGNCDKYQKPSCPEDEELTCPGSRHYCPNWQSDRLTRKEREKNET